MNGKPTNRDISAELAALEAMSDEDIDYSDIPRQAGAVKWSRPGALVPAENKQQVTLRLDADVLH